MPERRAPGPLAPRSPYFFHEVFEQDAVVDETDDLSPAMNNDIETEVKELMGLFDLPAFARRGQDLEGTLRRLHARCATERGKLLDMVQLRLKQWSGAAAGPDSWSGVFAGPIEPLWPLALAEPPTWAEIDAPLRRRRMIALDLVAAIGRFNRRWLKFIDLLNLEPANFAIEQYNRYYVLEKECVMGSTRLASRHFTPVPCVTKQTLLADHPTLSLPEPAGGRGQAVPD